MYCFSPLSMAAHAGYDQSVQMIIATVTKWRCYSLKMRMRFVLYENSTEQCHIAIVVGCILSTTSAKLITMR
jgi:hypothetical protein